MTVDTQPARLRRPNSLLAYLALLPAAAVGFAALHLYVQAGLFLLVAGMAFLGVKAVDQASAAQFEASVRADALRAQKAVHPQPPDKRVRPTAATAPMPPPPTALAPTRVYENRAKVDADTYRVNLLFRQLPGLVVGAGYLYAVQFATGVIKVGRTTNPRARLAKHRRDAKAFGAPVVDLWLSPAHENYQRNEATLIRACLKASGRYKNEYFHSIDLATVVRLASALTMKGAALTTEGAR